MRSILNFPFCISEIISALPIASTTTIPTDTVIRAICTDSREVRENDLFIALDGESGSGEKYVRDAIAKGGFAISTTATEGAIAVDNTRDALLSIAKAYKSKTSVKETVAVTGSVGKTTTVKFIRKILEEKYRVHSPYKNFNNHIGVPLTVFETPKDAYVLVAELGMNHPKEISRLSKCVSPDVGIITAIGTAHIGNLGSRENIAAAKLEILDGMNDGKLLIPYGEPLLSSAKNALTVAKDSSLSSFSLNVARGGTYSFHSKNGTTDNIRFFDAREHLLKDLAFAISTAEILGLSENEIRNGVERITESDLCQRFIKLSGFTIFDDSYNASLESISADLKYLKSLGGCYSAFLGDVLELGSRAATIHEKIGRTAAESGISNLYLIGELAEHTARGAIRGGMPREHIFINRDISTPEISIRHIKENHISGETVLFKASHRMRLDKIADILKEEME